MQDESDSPRASNFGFRWLASFARNLIDCRRRMYSASLIDFSRISLTTPANSAYRVWYFFSYSSKFIYSSPRTWLRPFREQMGSDADSVYLLCSKPAAA